jgi:hypothetical protein
MPFLMLLRGVFVMMYFYMVIIPLSLAILQLALRAGSTARGWYVTALTTLVLGVICFGGLPARIYVAVKEWDFRDPAHMRQFIQTYIRPDDHVVSDYPFYFELRDYVKLVAMPHYVKIIPPDEAAQIDVALVLDSACPDLTRDASSLRNIGGGWEKVAVFPTPDMAAYARTSLLPQKTFTLYRRQIAPPAPGPAVQPPAR